MNPKTNLGRGASPLGLPYTLSRAPLRRRASTSAKASVDKPFAPAHRSSHDFNAAKVGGSLVRSLAAKLHVTRPRRECYYNLAMAERSDLEHKGQAPQSVSCFIITVSDTRTEATDSSGRTIADLLTANGHSVAGRTIVRDDPALVRSTIERQLAYKAAQIIITTGGTGITSRDSTFEAISRLLEKRLDGFGELFRMLSYEEIGAAAMLSRACAGTIPGRIVVSLPGSEAAVRLAMEKLLLPELGHLVQQAGK
jgi:molybdenum cofactor biosynthesis protein B